MVNLNDVFAGKDPEFMDGMFPDLDWRRLLSDLNSGKPQPGGWSWFWNTFAPHGMLMSEDPPGRGIKPAADMAPALVSAVAKGFLAGPEPAAVYADSASTLYYWPLLKPGLTDDLVGYSDAVAEGDAEDDADPGFGACLA